MAQFLAQNDAFGGFDAVGVYEITGNTTDDLDTYELNLVLAADAKNLSVQFDRWSFDEHTVRSAVWV